MIERCVNLADFRAPARRRLPAPIFDYLDGGAEDEWSLANNARAFDRYTLVPSQLRDVSVIDASTKLFGRRIPFPVILSPTGLTRLFHRHKEIAVAKAAAGAGALYSLSTLGTSTIEDVAATMGEAPKLFQLYVFKDRGVTRELVARCKAAGYDALALTVDVAWQGNRERDRRSGFTMPPKLTGRSLSAFLARPGWCLEYWRDPAFRFVNVMGEVAAARGEAAALKHFIDTQFDRTLDWRAAEWLAAEWGGPFAIKGLQSADDARRARDAGASAIFISNHGGRQLDFAPAPFDGVEPMRDAVGDSVELIVDGGVRRGSDVLKALALGANACSIGRPYLYALAAGGQAGVARMLGLLRDEIERTMALCGRRSIAEIDRSLIGDAFGRPV